jgi:hypothetical protein
LDVFQGLTVGAGGLHVKCFSNLANQPIFRKPRCKAMSLTSNSFRPLSRENMRVMMVDLPVP